MQQKCWGPAMPHSTHPQELRISQELHVIQGAVCSAGKVSLGPNSPGTAMWSPEHHLLAPSRGTIGIETHFFDRTLKIYGQAMPLKETIH